HDFGTKCSHVAVRWRGDGALPRFQARGSPDGAQWGAWQELPVSVHARPVSGGEASEVAVLAGRFLQMGIFVRGVRPASSRLDAVVVTALDATDGPAAPATSAPSAARR